MRSLILNLSLALVSLTVFAGLALTGFEAYFRITEPQAKSGKIVTLQHDFELGWDSLPSIELVTISPGGRSVAFIGDSFTHNTQWYRIAAVSLAEQGHAVQANNLGVAGFGTTQAFLKLKRSFAELKPDYVVLLFFAWNDLRDNLDRPSIYYNYQTRLRPYVRETSDGVRYVPPPPIPHFLLSLRVYGKLWAAPQATLAKKLKQEMGLDWIASNDISAGFPYGDTTTWDPFYRTTQVNSPYVRLAWRRTEVVLQDLANFVRANGAKLIVLGIDNAFTVDQDVLDAHVKNREDFDPDLPLRRLGEILERQGTPYVNCLPALREKRREVNDKIYLGPPGNIAGHFTRAGEQVVADLAVEALLSRFGGDRSRLAAGL